MRECDNAAMRDLLPDLLGDQPGRPELAAARRHVTDCDACRAELALLASVRSAVRTPAVDTAAIAARIPAYRPSSRWQGILRAPAFRMAAAILLVVGIGTLTSDAPERGAPDTADARPVAAVPRELGVGTSLGELSEADLQRLVDEMGDLEAVTSTEADVVVIPAVDRAGS